MGNQPSLVGSSDRRRHRTGDHNIINFEAIDEEGTEVTEDNEPLSITKARPSNNDDKKR